MRIAAAAVLCSALAAPLTSAQEPKSDLADVEAKMRQRRVDEQSRLPPPVTQPDRSSGSNLETEWTSASEQMRRLAPNWWHRFERAPQNAPWRQRLMRSVIERHRELQRIQQRHPEQYKREIQQIELEDQIFGLAREMSQLSNSGDIETHRQKLREHVARLIDLRIANREARLARLQEQLAEERRRLEEHKSERDKMIDHHVEAVLNRPAGPRLGRSLRGGGDARDGPGDRPRPGRPPAGEPPPPPPH